MNAIPKASEFRCSECSVESRWNGNAPELPSGWIRSGRGLYCLHCRKARSVGGVGRESLIRWYLHTYPSKTDHQIAAQTSGYGEKKSATRQVAALRKSLGIPRTPGAAKPKPKPKTRPPQRRPGPTPKTRLWLREFLAGGEPRLCSEAKTEGARKGFKLRAVVRAASELKVIRAGANSRRTWQLPDDTEADPIE